MKKILLYFIMLLVISGVVGCADLLPSVCDQNTEPSVLCDIADKADVRIEDIGNTFIFVNLVALNKGKYTKQQALSVMHNIRGFIENPITYTILNSKITSELKLYPGLFEASAVLLGGLVDQNDIYPKDRELLLTWLDNRIRELSD